jgi:CBS domain-containing protein
MKVHQIMTAHARGIAPDNTLVEAAGLMRELDVGALPVFNGEELTGMVTDRDMVLRAIADGRDPANTSVGHVMSQGVIFVLAHQEVEEVVRLMQEKQVRRLPVLNAEKRLVGIVSIGDIAISSSPAFGGIALREVSQPARPSTRQRRLSQASEPARMSKTALANARSGGEKRAKTRPTKARPSAVKKRGASGGKAGAKRGVAARVRLPRAAGRKTATPGRGR